VLMSRRNVYQGEPQIQVHFATVPDQAGVRLRGALFARLEEAVRAARSYRGKVLSLESSDNYSGEGSGIKVHNLSPVDRQQVILPAETLDLVERNVIEFARHRDRLKALRQSTRKGLLFHGPPGNGKTYTIRYLMHALASHTKLLITGSEVGRIGEYMALARLLQPALVVIEDVDLVAKERIHSGTCEEAVLNVLLNEMDGLAPDAEIMFILTTNHPELLEEALMSRPGRIDQTVAFHTPTADERRRLALLYAGEVELSSEVLAKLVAATDGSSAAFIKELIRRAIEHHLTRCDSAGIERCDLETALDELALKQGVLNGRLLGFALSR